MPLPTRLSRRGPCAIWPLGTQGPLRETLRRQNINAGLIALTLMSAGAASEGFSAKGLQSMLKAGGVGAGVSFVTSLVKGDSGYELVKQTVSGFFSGAVLGVGWSGSLGKVFLGGAIAGGVGEISNQEFDNVFGDENGYNLQRILLSAGVGGVANILSESVVNRINSAIDRSLSEGLAKTRTSAFRKLIRQAILEKNPRLGNRQIKILVNTEVKQYDELLIRDAKNEKAAVTQAIEKSIDYLKDKFNELMKNE